ncbi:MAG: BlaI/MecI/CopY family transcriptional regulator [Proteobacteria bacterium]|nr:BlaI/MecI/CopY family transcriptional regulator [Pseudomonadota bacterium]
MSPRITNSAIERLLTDVELELMTTVWSLGKATVKEVVSALPDTRQLAYTTVATVMKILEQKEFLKCQKDSYAHVFYPTISKSDYEGTCIDHMVTCVFDGEPVALVQRLLNAKKLSKEDLQAIEETLKELSAQIKGKK